MIKIAVYCTVAALVLAGCDARSTSTGDVSQAPTSSGADVPMPAGLTADERAIWATLNDQAKRDAVAFIEAGGTLTQFVSP